MEYVHKQTINFRDDRTPLQRRVSIGYEGDNLVERLEFVLPELVGGQVAKLMITGADAVTLNRIDDGRYAADLTREMIGPDGRRDAYVRIDGVSGQIWQGGPLRIVTGKLPDVEGEIERVYPTAVGQMLTAMAEHTGEMEAQEERVERAAQRAEDAAERAETGGGSGGPGEDGGYYRPTVTDGVLTWTPSKADMPSVPASDVRGPAGQDGQPGKDGADGAPGKSAYQYAQDGGYTGTEAEFAEKLAEEIPEAYTLPTASETIKGGVKVGKGLVMDGEALGVEPEDEYELIETIVIEGADQLEVRRSYEVAYKSLLVSFETPKVDVAGYPYLFVAFGVGGVQNTGGVGMTYKTTTSDRYSGKCIIRPLYGKVDLFGYHGVSGSLSNMAGATNAHSVIEATTLDFIRIYTFTDGIPVGTKFNIWGVRAK